MHNTRSASPDLISAFASCRFGITAPQPVSNPGDRTSISLDLLRGLAVMWNVRANGATEQLSARGPNLLDAVSLGTPRLLIARMVRECANTN